MEQTDILSAVRELGATRAEIAARLVESPLAPRATLSASALGMWFTHGRVPHMWRSAALERLGRIELSEVANEGEI